MRFVLEFLKQYIFMMTYSVKEASEMLGITERAVQKKCKRDGVLRKNNRYAITADEIESWRTERTERTNLKTRAELIERINELEAELEQYKISDNERIEVFTNEDYAIFEQRLREWFSMQKDLQHQEQLFETEKKSLSELVEHYKNQFEYQRKQSERILDMHQQLIDNIQKQSTVLMQRQTIEAKEKNVRE